MDPGTNCRDVLEGRSYQLRNGWIGVVNRGQADINSQVGQLGRHACMCGGGCRHVGKGANFAQEAVPCALNPCPTTTSVQLPQMTMKDARAKELDFFHKKAEYSGLRNIGTGFLSTELSEKLISSVRRQLPNISGFVNKSVMDLKRELEAMGGPAANSRGEMIHLVLTLCRKFETCFAKLIDGGKGGG